MPNLREPSIPARSFRHSRRQCLGLEPDRAASQAVGEECKSRYFRWSYGPCRVAQAGCCRAWYQSQQQVLQRPWCSWRDHEAFAWHAKYLPESFRWWTLGLLVSGWRLEGSNRIIEEMAVGSKWRCQSPTLLTWYSFVLVHISKYALSIQVS